MDYCTHKWILLFRFSSFFLTTLMAGYGIIPLAYANAQIEDYAIRAKTGKVQLDWSILPNTEKYEILRSLQLFGGFTKIADRPSTVSVFLDETVENGTLYYYKVKQIPIEKKEPAFSLVLAALPPASRLRLAYVLDVIGQSLAEAESNFSLNSFSTGLITHEASATIPAGHVIIQDPPANSHVPRGFAIDLVLSSGPPATTPPTVMITVPEDDGEFIDQEVISFSANASDAEEGDLSPTILWTSSIDGEFGMGPSVLQTLSVGAHTISASVTDGDGLVGNDSITLQVQPKNHPPIANAGPDQTVRIQEDVTLDGSRSSDADGNSLTFNWALISVPVGSEAVLSNISAVMPTFTVDGSGDYVAQLIVNDGEFDSIADTVAISTINSAPIALAGPDQTVFIGSTVQLDGSGSSDADGDLLTFLWSLRSIPPESSAVLSDDTSVMPTFVVDREGEYQAQLIVNDGIVDSTADIVVVATKNSPPVANAGRDQTVFVNDVVKLDGTASNDVDGDLLTFAWSFTSLPGDSTAIISASDSVMPTFTVDIPGTYVLQLIVNDGREYSAPDTTIMTTENSRPSADAGPDQTVFIDDLVSLDGSASHDVDGDDLIFFWSLESTPIGSLGGLSDPTAIQPTIRVDIPGIYVVQLIVNDGSLDSMSDTVTISTENSRPIADAGADQQVFVNRTVILDGSASEDVDGDSLVFNWSFTSRPNGSTVILSDPTSAMPAFSVDRSGIYVIQLLVNDGILNSDPDTVTISTIDPQLSITVPADVTVECDDDHSPLSTGTASASDICPGDITISFTDSTFENNFCASGALRFISRTWIATNACGDRASATQTLIVRDTTAPTITAPLDLTLNCGDSTDTVVTGTATISDNCDSAPTLSFTDSLPPGTCPLIITRTWTATDACGNSAMADQILSIAPRLVTVPDVLGLNQSDAESSISSANLVVGTITIASGDTLPPGHVIGQQPGAGSEVAEGSPVDIVVREEVLIENSNFKVSFDYTFFVPNEPSSIQFTYTNLNFDESDDFVNDAFEAALLDTNDNSLVLPIGSGRDPFFNTTEGELQVVSPNVIVNNRTVSVDLTHVPGGTEAVLALRLVNNDTDTTTSVRITHLEVIPGSLNTSAGTIPNATIASSQIPVDFSLLSDLTPSFQPVYGQTSFNAEDRRLFAGLQLRNSGTFLVDAPLIVAIDHISDPSVSTHGMDGFTPDGLPYYDFTQLVGGGSLFPDESTAARTLSFLNPNQIQFSFDLVVLGQINQPPKFVSNPNTEAIIDKPYQYKTRATDPNNDTLTFTLLTGPDGLSIDPMTGIVSWSPTAEDLGNKTILLKVDDGREGTDEQEFTLNVIEQPPNRPPVFTSTPVIDAKVNTPYTYDADAVDPDRDVLEYALITRPDGMTIDTSTGLS